MFVNPSQSEVLSTTTAEALAMGKFVVIQKHASNEFFMGFQNVRTYETRDEFVQVLQEAMDSTPAPLTHDEKRALSWEGATDRFISAISNCTIGDMLPSFADHTARWVHQSVQKGGYFGDAMRIVSGGGPIARQSWLNQRRFREADVTEIVDKSVGITPPQLPQATAAA